MHTATGRCSITSFIASSADRSSGTSVIDFAADRHAQHFQCSLIHRRTRRQADHRRDRLALSTGRHLLHRFGDHVQDEQRVFLGDFVLRAMLRDQHQRRQQHLIDDADSAELGALPLDERVASSSSRASSR